MKRLTLAALVVLVAGLTTGCAGTPLAPTLDVVPVTTPALTSLPTETPVVAAPIVEPGPVVAPTPRPTPPPVPPTVVAPPVNPISAPPERQTRPVTPCPDGFIEFLQADGSMGCRPVPAALVCPIGTHPVLGPDGLTCEP